MKKLINYYCNKYSTASLVCHMLDIVRIENNLASQTSLPIKIKSFKVSVAVIGPVWTQLQHQFPVVIGRCRLDRPVQDRPAARRD